MNTKKVSSYKICTKHVDKLSILLYITVERRNGSENKKEKERKKNDQICNIHKYAKKCAHEEETSKK